jgi:hypothetical protein
VVLARRSEKRDFESGDINKLHKRRNKVAVVALEGLCKALE